MTICKTCYERSELERLKKASFIISHSENNHHNSLSKARSEQSLFDSESSNLDSSSFDQFVAGNFGEEIYNNNNSNGEFVVSKRLAQLLNEVRHKQNLHEQSIQNSKILSQSHRRHSLRPKSSTPIIEDFPDFDNHNMLLTANPTTNKNKSPMPFSKYRPARYKGNRSWYFWI